MTNWSDDQRIDHGMAAVWMTGAMVVVAWDSGWLPAFGMLLAMAIAAHLASGGYPRRRDDWAADEDRLWAYMTDGRGVIVERRLSYEEMGTRPIYTLSPRLEGDWSGVPPVITTILINRCVAATRARMRAKGERVY